MEHKEKIRLAGIRLYGSEAEWRKALSENGKKGGSAKVKKGFALMDEATRKAISSRGGKNGKTVR